MAKYAKKEMRSEKLKRGEAPTLEGFRVRVKKKNKECHIYKGMNRVHVTELNH